ncbi:MAG: threonine aldolase family protein [Oscillospiraceae bacterium]|jgi:threonine aldolase
MIRFDSDYTEGAHPAVIERLRSTNYEQTAGYGEDEYCCAAKALIKKLCSREADVHFLVGGTQTNLSFISAALRPHQGVLAPLTGHVNTHETGAIEATGHKVIGLPSDDGKISARQIKKAVENHFGDEAREHIVQPKLVYISHPTELGTLYSLHELEEISKTCRETGLILYVDGARLGYGLAADPSVSIEALARLADAFYIGGTKLGALFGEALVITNANLSQDFRYIIKQKGGMLAKGRLLGLQFLALLEGGLYTRLGRHANDMAAVIRQACIRRSLPLLVDSPTNQQFVIMPDSMLRELAKKYAFSTWGRVDAEHCAVRFCTSWATPEENVLALARDIEAI